MAQEKIKENDRIQKRILELQEEMQMHQQRANQAQQIMNAETQQFVAKQGAILEFQKLLEEPKETNNSKV